MALGGFDFRFMKLQITLLVVTVVALGAVSWAVWADFYQVKYVGAGLSGVHHLGSAFKIDEFNVDGTDGGNVGWEGGGGRSTCCVDLPKKWTPGLTVVVRWAISDWSKVNRAETAAGNYDSVSSAGMFRANVPVEKYDEPDQLYVHFFPDGRARVVSSPFGTGIHHPIADDDPTAAQLASKGAPVKQLFTDAEIAELHRKAALRTKWLRQWQ